MNTKNRTVITANQHVLIRLPSEGTKIVELRPSGVVSLGKFGSFLVDGVLGYPFGQSFEIVEGQDVKPILSLQHSSDPKDVSEEPEGDLNKEELTKMFSENNQNIIDIGSKIQKLTNDDIEELKKSGATSSIGQHIIDQMIAGHEGFDKKTLFSQQKYLRRKQQKFLRRFTVEYLGSSQMLQYYIDKDLPRVIDLSEESLGLLMTYGNVRPGGNYLLIDETGGVVLYAMLERMGGEGQVVLVHENEHVNIIALRHAGYSEEYINRMVKTIDYLQFLEPENEKINWEDKSEEELAEMKSSKREQYEKRRERATAINSVIETVQNGNFDALISVSTLHQPTLLPRILDTVGGSRPIVIYNQYKELLLETQHVLTKDKRVLAPSIFETRVRPYQTIPGRMHPLMTMRGGGGYILWGTKVIPQEGITAVGRGISKRKREESPATDATDS
ncbi:uncharacterized protein SPAPADRAFT_59679 [Spathaspora passalidarum NRRL Y-27907]|uniref:tRNA (adenine(58)-N(1))-methyltransferase non-catalytic subunit TRM6 n=1 Tax=Spathaspora passalidarum (strain NRRL Y-27907 / 11-Y1) TaxID=619300 RepID=G3AHU0_SPAPN|nr:uncharacterized protein SPAPADRAFT_59679 [Spathaspora passalidarum NRRL Y-27907]EGW34254.1 hypothetical protein SPAPADRAFT_59679 [Spathaspora passalidarum NRRL Y-27907]